MVISSELNLNLLETGRRESKFEDITEQMTPDHTPQYGAYRTTNTIPVIPPHMGLSSCVVFCF